MTWSISPTRRSPITTCASGSFGVYARRRSGPASLRRSTFGLSLLQRKPPTKLLVKLGHAPGFGHREIRVASDLSKVCWHGNNLDLVVAGDAEHVHAIAWSRSRSRPLARVARTSLPGGPAARELVCELVAAATGCSTLDLAIVRDAIPSAWDGFGPPRVEHLGTSMAGADVSLSHDGPFVAGAAIIGEATPP